MRDFATFKGKTQGQRHIKPLHWYLASRLVIEGGFLPDEVTPHPPISTRGHGNATQLVYDPSVATGSERTILGGMKTKDVDVVVTKAGIGPVLAISCKGMTGALRNLTNRMEETIGECTNVHIAYPALVFGYLFVIRGNTADAAEASSATRKSNAAERVLRRNDVVLGTDATPVESLVRFHYALSQMEGRNGLRDDVSRYEAVALSVVSASGCPIEAFPPLDSAIRLDRFFETLYLRYEERFIFNAASLRKVTARRLWPPQSPLFEPGATPTVLDYAAHLAD